MKRYLFICALAGAFATSAAAQPPSPQTTPPRPSPTTPQTQQQTMDKVTVEGCLLREADVGRQPNVAERAGIGEDFVIANAKVVKGKAPDVARTGATGTTRPESDATRAGQPSAGQASSMQPMYEVSELDESQLKNLVGKRVQIEGTFEDTDRQPSAGSDDLPELRATSIREVPGTCPAPKRQQ